MLAQAKSTARARATCDRRRAEGRERLHTFVQAELLERLDAVMQARGLRSRGEVLETLWREFPEFFAVDPTPGRDAPTLFNWRRKTNRKSRA